MSNLARDIHGRPPRTAQRKRVVERKKGKKEEARNDRDTSKKGGDIVRKRASYSISRARIIREQHRPGSLSSPSLCQ